MGTFSIWHWFILIYLVIVAIPIAQILRRVGYSRWWAVIAFVPLLNLIALWVFAFCRWPRER